VTAGQIVATFYDGQVAVGRPVHVELRDDGLALTSSNGDDGVFITWVWSQLCLADEDGVPVSMTLKPDAASSARLKISDSQIIAAILERAPQLQAGRRRVSRIRRRGLIIGITIGALAALVLVVLPNLVTPVASLVGEATRERWGAGLTTQIIAHYQDDTEANSCRNNAGRRSIDNLMRQLTTASFTDQQIQVFVIPSHTANALAVPGGRIVLFSGMVSMVESPDELAGILAHELAHILLNHPVEGVVHSIGLSAIADLLTGGGGVAAADFASHLVEMKYSREQEMEADDTALLILAAAGLRADGFDRVMRRFAEQENELVPEFLSTHPASEARAAKARLFGSGGKPGMSDEVWERLKRQCGHSQAKSAGGS